jgi:catechol 2,3-dioxygenase-like lactoylglutathione lyase family enzyme
MNHFVLFVLLHRSKFMLFPVRSKDYSMLRKRANRKFYRSPVLFIVLLINLVVGWSSQTGRSQTTPAAITFHHVHLNSINPTKAIDFYTKTFDVTRQTSLAGWDGVQSEKMYLLFNKVSKAPTSELESAIWHFGWGSTAMETDYQKHLDNGVSFATPMTKLGSGLLFAYMKAPDGALVEINTSTTRAFIHVHLFSDAPLCTADWYVTHLGATSRANAQRTGPCEVPFAAPSEPLGVIRQPSATVRFGDISLIIYPRQRPGKFVSPRGRVVDHIALEVTDLTATLERLRKEGVKVLEEPHPFGKSKNRAAMIEGPDAIAIELVE